MEQRITDHVYGADQFTVLKKYADMVADLSCEDSAGPAVRALKRKLETEPGMFMGWVV